MAMPSTAPARRHLARRPASYSPTEKDKKGKPVFNTTWEWRATTKPGKLFIEICKWPSDGKFVVPMTNDVKDAYLLADPDKKLQTTKSDDGLTIMLPASAPDPIASVVGIDLDGPVNPLPSALAKPAPVH